MASTGKRGLGSIRKLRSGRYQLRYTDPFGVQKGGGTFKTKALAEMELNRIQGAIERGSYQKALGIKHGDVDPKALTLASLGQYWREQRLNSRGQPLSPNTLAEYERIANTVLQPLSTKKIKEITSGMVSKWWLDNEPRTVTTAEGKTKTVGGRGRNAAYKHLNTLMKFALKQQWITENPCGIEGANIFVPDEAPAVPDLQQVEIMLEHAKEPIRTVIELAAWGGLRKGEILELRRKDIEQLTAEDGTTWIVLNVNRGVIWEGTESSVRIPKTKGSIRKVTLPQRANEGLLRHLKTIPINPEALLFSSNAITNEHWAEGTLDKRWRVARALAGYEGSFHSLRAFAATQYGLSGATVAELMDRFGHRNIHTAMRYQRTTGRENELLRKLG